MHPNKLNNSKEARAGSKRIENLLKFLHVAPVVRFDCPSAFILIDLITIKLYYIHLYIYKTRKLHQKVPMSKPMQSFETSKANILLQKLPLGTAAILPTTAQNSTNFLKYLNKLGAKWGVRRKLRAKRNLSPTRKMLDLSLKNCTDNKAPLSLGQSCAIQPSPS